MSRRAEKYKSKINSSYSEYLDDFKAAINEYKQYSNDRLPIENLEKFLDYFEIEHYLNLNNSIGKNTKYGNIQNISKLLITEILLNKQNKIRNENIYYKFVDNINSSDVILTLNYDTLLENIFIKKNKCFQYVPNNFSKVKKNVDNASCVPIIKLHGSINWFDFNDYEDRILSHLKDEFFLGISTDFIFNNHLKRVKLNPIIPYKFIRNEAKLNNIYYISESELRRYLKSIKRESILSKILTYTFPAMLTPSYSKLLYAESLRDLFSDTNKYTRELNKIIIIGCSLNEYDSYIRQIIYWTSIFRINNYEEIIVINKASNEKEKETLDKSYSFLCRDALKPKMFYEGLNEESIDYIFR